jgi:hypothetical protein
MSGHPLQSMARKVFFSFDFDDVLAVNVVRNSNVVRGPDKQLPFSDHSIYEAAKNTPNAIKRAIDSAIIGTSVTVVLNGLNTYNSNWCRYEIAKSLEKGNGFIVVDLVGVGPRPVQQVGPNPFAYVGGVSKDAMDVNTTVDVYEHHDGKWKIFDMLGRISNVDAKYPLRKISGRYNLASRFTSQTTWKSISVYFDSLIEAAAADAGWPRST